MKLQRVATALAFATYASLLGMVSIPSAYATYNANTMGVVVDVVAYTEGDYIFFRLADQPTSHPQCNPAFFVIPDSVPESRRQMLFARLLAAEASGEPQNIGYDATGECANGYIRVHRVG